MRNDGFSWFLGNGFMDGVQIQLGGGGISVKLHTRVWTHFMGGWMDYMQILGAYTFNGILVGLLLVYEVDSVGREEFKQILIKMGEGGIIDICTTDKIFNEINNI